MHQPFYKPSRLHASQRLYPTSWLWARKTPSLGPQLFHQAWRIATTALISFLWRSWLPLFDTLSASYASGHTTMDHRCWPALYPQKHIPPVIRTTCPEAIHRKWIQIPLTCRSFHHSRKETCEIKKKHLHKIWAAKIPCPLTSTNGHFSNGKFHQIIFDIASDKTNLKQILTK